MSDEKQGKNKKYGSPHRWKKGESGNPAGRKHKEDCLLSCIKEELAKPSLAQGLTNEQLIASMLVAQATKGNLKATELLMAYTTAKPTASVDVTSKGTPITSFAFVLPDGTKVSPKQLSNSSGG